MTPSDYELIEQGYDPPRMNEGELVYTGPGELAALRAEIEDEKSSHRATMKDFLELQQVYRAACEQWNPVYKLVLDERDALRARVAKLEAALTDIGVNAGGEASRRARATLTAEPASGEVS